MPGIMTEKKGFENRAPSGVCIEVELDEAMLGRIQTACIAGGYDKMNDLIVDALSQYRPIIDAGVPAQANLNP